MADLHTFWNELDALATEDAQSDAAQAYANIIAVKDAIDETFEALSHVEFVMNRGQVIKGA